MLKMLLEVKRYVVTVVILGLALVWLLVSGVPFLYMVLSSFKQQFEMLTSGIFSFPKYFYFKNYQDVLAGNFLQYFINSILVVGISLTILLFISACAAYPLARFNLKLNKLIFALIVAGMSIPVHVTLIPIFLITNEIELYDTIWSLIGPYIAFNLPISIFILTSFMVGIPKELEEAAEIDGYGKFQIFFFIIFPLSKSGITTLAIYNAVIMWNEFSFALTLTQSPGKRTLPLAVWEYQGQYTNNIPMIMTVLTLSALPMIVAFIIGQDKLIKGMMFGAIKG